MYSDDYVEVDLPRSGRSTHHHLPHVEDHHHHSYNHTEDVIRGGGDAQRTASAGRDKRGRIHHHYAHDDSHPDRYGSSTRASSTRHVGGNANGYRTGSSTRQGAAAGGGGWSADGHHEVPSLEQQKREKAQQMAIRIAQVEAARRRQEHESAGGNTFSNSHGRPRSSSSTNTPKYTTKASRSNSPTALTGGRAPGGYSRGHSPAASGRSSSAQPLRPTAGTSAVGHHTHHAEMATTRTSNVDNHSSSSPHAYRRCMVAYGDLLARYATQPQPHPQRHPAASVHEDGPRATSEGYEDEARLIAQECFDGESALERLARDPQASGMAQPMVSPSSPHTTHTPTPTTAPSPTAASSQQQSVLRSDPSQVQEHPSERTVAQVHQSKPILPHTTTPTGISTSARRVAAPASRTSVAAKGAAPNPTPLPLDESILLFIRDYHSAKDSKKKAISNKSSHNNAEAVMARAKSPSPPLEGDADRRRLEEAAQSVPSQPPAQAVPSTADLRYVDRGSMSPRRGAGVSPAASVLKEAKMEVKGASGSGMAVKSQQPPPPAAVPLERLDHTSLAEKQLTSQAPLLPSHVVYVLRPQDLSPDLRRAVLDTVVAAPDDEVVFARGPRDTTVANVSVPRDVVLGGSVPLSSSSTATAASRRRMTVLDLVARATAELDGRHPSPSPSPQATHHEHESADGGRRPVRRLIDESFHVSPPPVKSEATHNPAAVSALQGTMHQPSVDHAQAHVQTHIPPPAPVDVRAAYGEALAASAAAVAPPPTRPAPAALGKDYMRGHGLALTPPAIHGTNTTTTSSTRNAARMPSPQAARRYRSLVRGATPNPATASPRNGSRSATPQRRTVTTTTTSASRGQSPAHISKPRSTSREAFVAALTDDGPKEHHPRGSNANNHTPQRRGPSSASPCRGGATTYPDTRRLLSTPLHGHSLHALPPSQPRLVSWATRIAEDVFHRLGSGTVLPSRSRLAAITAKEQQRRTVLRSAALATDGALSGNHHSAAAGAAGGAAGGADGDALTAFCTNTPTVAHAIFRYVLRAQVGVDAALSATMDDLEFAAARFRAACPTCAVVHYFLYLCKDTADVAEQLLLFAALRQRALPFAAHHDQKVVLGALSSAIASAPLFQKDAEAAAAAAEFPDAHCGAPPVAHAHHLRSPSPLRRKEALRADRLLRAAGADISGHRSLDPHGSVTIPTPPAAAAAMEMQLVHRRYIPLQKVPSAVRAMTADIAPYPATSTTSTPPSGGNNDDWAAGTVQEAAAVDPVMSPFRRQQPVLYPHDWKGDHHGQARVTAAGVKRAVAEWIADELPFGGVAFDLSGHVDLVELVRAVVAERLGLWQAPPSTADQGAGAEGEDESNQRHSSSRANGTPAAVSREGRGMQSPTRRRASPPAHELAAATEALASAHSHRGAERVSFAAISAIAPSPRMGTSSASANISPASPTRARASLTPASVPTSVAAAQSHHGHVLQQQQHSFPAPPVQISSSQLAYLHDEHHKAPASRTQSPPRHGREVPSTQPPLSSLLSPVPRDDPKWSPTRPPI